MERTDRWIKPAYNDAETKKFYEKLTVTGIKEEMNFRSMKELLRKYRTFQRFFCEASTDQMIQGYKEKLGMILGDERLVELDKMFPEILQIGTKPQIYFLKIIYIELMTLKGQYFCVRKILHSKVRSFKD